MVEKTSTNGNLISSVEDGFPVGVVSPNGIVIPIQKETVILQNNNYKIDLDAYLSYAGLTDDSGVWKIYVASGGKGSKGEPGESLSLTVGNVVAGAFPSVELVGESPNQTLNFVLPAFGDSFEIVRESIGNKIFVSSKAIPVMIQTANGKYYNIRGKEISLNDDKSKFIIDISNALIVNNSASFSGEWIVYFAGCVKEHAISNIPFTPSTLGVGQFNNNSKEVVLETYFINQKSIFIYHSGNYSGTFSVSVKIGEDVVKTIDVETSSTITKTEIVFNEEITGNAKIVCNTFFSGGTEELNNVNIYKIEG